MQWERLGPYRIERRIGRGGMGIVYSAVTDVTGERTAIKVLPTSGVDDGLSDRFAAEIDSLRMLHHPNIVSILGYGEEQDCRYYVMELVDGLSLQELLDQGRPLQWQEATRIGVQVCRALKHAHDHGVIHRDIKPANLLLSREGIVKLSDFGIAKMFGNSGQTADGGVIGTAEYMSPEQADGRNVTYRTDLYSLGGLLYALLAGRPPFRARSFIDMLQMQRFAEAEPVMRLNPQVPRALNDLVAHLLQKDPAKRVPTALVAGRQLESMLAYDQAAQGRPGAPHSLDVAAHLGSAAMDRAAESPPSHSADLRFSIDKELAETPAAPVAPEAPDERSVAAGPDAGATPAVPVVGSDVVPGAVSEADREHVLRGATSEFRVALPPKSPTGAANGAPRVDRSMGLNVERTYTPIGKHERGPRMPEADEPTPWISPGTWALVFAMLAVGLSAWYWLQPPAAEKLYATVSQAAADGKVESLIDVEDDIQAFIDHYPADRRVREMQTYLDEIELHRLERRFEFRAKFFSKNEGLSPAERMYFEAIGYLHLDPELGRRKLQALVDLFRDTKDASKQTRECLQLALKQLDRLDRSLPQQVSADRRLLEQKLAEAEVLDGTDPAAAQRMRAAIVELYGNERWADALVEQARAASAPRNATAELPRAPNDATPDEAAPAPEPVPPP